MRAPHRTRNRLLAFAGVGWGALAACLPFLADADPHWAVPTVAILGLNAGMILGIMALHTHGACRRYDRMRRGEGVLARWTVDRERWDLFLANARWLAEQPGARGSMLALPETPPVLGYQVTVAEDGIRLEDEFEPMRRDAVAQVAGAVLEFRQLVPVGKRMDWFTYRLPIGAGAEGDAARVAAHFAESRGRLTRPMRKLWVLLAFVAILGAFILVVGTLTDWR